MDRMEVVGLILGSHGTSPDSIDRGNPSFKPTPIPESVKEEIREGFTGALPKDVDFDLMEATGEHQLVEPIEADVYYNRICSRPITASSSPTVPPPRYIDMGI